MSKKRNLGRLRTSPDALQRVPASRLIILRPPHEDAVGTRTIISRTLTVAVRLLALEVGVDHNEKLEARSRKRGTRNQEPGARNHEPGARNQERRTRNEKAGMRNEEPGTRNQE